MEISYFRPSELYRAPRAARLAQWRRQGRAPRRACGIASAICSRSGDGGARVHLQCMRCSVFVGGSTPRRGGWLGSAAERAKTARAPRRGESARRPPLTRTAACRRSFLATWVAPASRGRRYSRRRSSSPALARHDTTRHNTLVLAAPRVAAKGNDRALRVLPLIVRLAILPRVLQAWALLLALTVVESVVVCILWTRWIRGREKRGEEWRPGHKRSGGTGTHGVSPRRATQGEPGRGCRF